MQLQEAELNIISPQATQIIAHNDFEQASEVKMGSLSYLLLGDCGTGVHKISDMHIGAVGNVI